MTKPEEVTSFAQEYECDVVVAGLGFAGTAASRELAEQGKKVLVIEKQPEDSYAATGNEFASLNAAILKERGVPAIDPVEFYQNFMKITANMPNPELVMKFAQNSEANSNWYLAVSYTHLDVYKRQFRCEGIFPKMNQNVFRSGKSLISIIGCSRRTAMVSLMCFMMALPMPMDPFISVMPSIRS